MSGETEKPKTILVTVETDDGFVEKSLDPLQIEFLRDTYYETRLHLDNGEVWRIKENLKELSKKLDEWKLASGIE